MSISFLYAGDSLSNQSTDSIFLAGPTAGDVDMLGGWRRMIIEKLSQYSIADQKTIQFIIPEPKSGLWSSVINETYGEKEQTLWEHKAILNSKVVAFWLPTFWNKDKAGPYPANIGPSSRFEFGYALSLACNDPGKSIVVGSPESAQSLHWAHTLCAHYNIKWHYPDPAKPHELIPASFIEALLTIS